MLKSNAKRALLGSALVVGLSALLVVPLAATASATTQTTMPTKLPATHLRALFDVGVTNSLTPAEAAEGAKATVKLKTFTSTVTDPQNSEKYTYNMVGTNPEVKGTSSSTTIKTLLVPLVIKYPDGIKWNPTAKDSCDTGASAFTRTKNSPIFVNRAWTLDGTSVGTGQYIDAFQRSNFWNYTQPTGTNSGYSIHMGMTTLPALTVTVPGADAYYFANGNGCGNGDLGDVNINWLQSYLQNTAIPSLSSEGVNASTFPIFVVHNVVAFTSNDASDCCVLGYHSAYSHSGTQTYAFGDYDNEGSFTGFSDAAGLSHETDEWMDDPLGTNPTAPWGHIGQVTGCQANLEVGDPLSGTIFPVTSGSFTYHMQELAFFSWFYRQSPSIGLNGVYSDQGTFTTPAAACT
jgi:hypothetical protein